MKNILIVDDNVQFANVLGEYFKENNDDIKVIGIASNGEEALNYFKNFIIDVVLLDLNMPKVNGLTFLEKIQGISKIDIIIISGEVSYINKIEYKYFEIIKKVYIKPFSLFQLNNDLKNICIENYNISSKNIIEAQLSNFNVGSNGYEYLIECIDETLKHPSKLKNMEKNLFPYISEKYNVTNPKNIKWSLQKLIDSMSRYTETATILKYFPYTKHPTLKVFITTIDDIILNKNNIC